MTYTYDAENRMVTETNTGGLSATYRYDADGKRVEKNLNSGAVIVYVYDAQGNLSAEYGSASGAPPCTTCYYSYDHLGSVRMVTDKNANVVSRHDYLPFGDEIPGGMAWRNSQFDTPDNVSQRFTGKERDTETGLDFFGARYYSSAIERFMSADEPFADQHPADPQSWNLYSYVRNSPLISTDPTGRNEAGTLAGGPASPDEFDKSADCNFGKVINCAPGISALPKTPGSQKRVSSWPAMRLIAWPKN